MVVPDVLTGGQLAFGRKVVAAMHAKKPHAEDHVGALFLWPPATFTMLAGLWLTDQTELNRGNLWIWPGTHLRFGDYLAEHGADALTRLDEMNPGPGIDLGEPIQTSSPASSVLFARYLLAHNLGGHDGLADDDRRETIYYRLHATSHRARWRDALTEFRIPKKV